MDERAFATARFPQQCHQWLASNGCYKPLSNGIAPKEEGGIVASEGGEGAVGSRQWLLLQQGVGGRMWRGNGR